MREQPSRKDSAMKYLKQDVKPVLNGGKNTLYDAKTQQHYIYRPLNKPFKTVLENAVESITEAHTNDSILVVYEAGEVMFNVFSYNFMLAPVGRLNKICKNGAMLE